MTSVSFLLGLQRGAWPVIEPLQKTYTFVRAPDKDTPVLIVARDLSSRPVYKLECHNDHYENERSDIDYSGTFQCALFALRNNTTASWNLLADDSAIQKSTDWMNRGRMLASQLYGECGPVPEFGWLRHFRVRGMLITFRFTNLVWPTPSGPDDVLSRQTLNGFTFEVSIAQDAAATARTSERVQPPSGFDSCHFPLSDQPGK